MFAGVVVLEAYSYSCFTFLPVGVWLPCFGLWTDVIVGPNKSFRPISKVGLSLFNLPLGALKYSLLDASFCPCEYLLELRPWAEDEKPVVDMHICTVALDIRSKASRQASAGGHFSIRSPRTDVAARIVKSTSSIVYCGLVDNRRYRRARRGR